MKRKELSKDIESRKLKVENGAYTVESRKETYKCGPTNQIGKNLKSDRSGKLEVKNGRVKKEIWKLSKIHIGDRDNDEELGAGLKDRNNELK